jgi:predicted nucleic acid-binding protein
MKEQRAAGGAERQITKFVEDHEVASYQPVRDLACGRSRSVRSVGSRVSVGYSRVGGGHCSRAAAMGHVKMTRKIVIDADVIGHINRGNARAAEALRTACDNGASVYISAQAYNELTSQPGKMYGGVGPDLPRTAAANKRLLEDLRIEVAPSGTLAERVPVYAKNAEKPTLQETDAMTVAQARAINAEVWSFDRAIRNDPQAVEKRFGVVVAGETQRAYYEPGQREDYRIARKLMHLKEIEITVGGHVVDQPTQSPPTLPASGDSSQKS